MWRAAASPDPPEPEWKWGYLSLRPPLFYVAAPYLVLTLTGSDGTNVVHTTPVGLDATGPSIRSCLSRSFTVFVGADVHPLTGLTHGLRGTAVTCCVGAMMVSWQGGGGTQCHRDPSRISGDRAVAMARCCAAGHGGRFRYAAPRSARARASASSERRPSRNPGVRPG